MHHRAGASLAVVFSLSLAAACSLGCGEGGSTIVRVEIRALGVPAEDLARVRAIVLTVSGDEGDGGPENGQPIAAGDDLLDGEHSLIYHPVKKSGVLRYRIALRAADDSEIAAGEVDGDLRSRNVVIQVRPRGNDGGGPPLDAGAGDAPGADAPAADRPPADAPTGDAAGDVVTCAQSACSGTVADSCCPTACAAATDVDCAGCGNARIEAGETCDPPGSCPSCDDQNDCTTDTTTGSAATCNVVCSSTPKTCQTAAMDRCCPVGCTAATDIDCAGCGDGVVDRNAGETCDPPSTCPTPASCMPAACWQVTTFTGSAPTCNARCSTVAVPCSGTTMDGCCPPECNTSAANRDVDCSATCGNSVVEAGETCDPVTSCPTACPAKGCQLFDLMGSAAMCTARCTAGSTITLCSQTPDSCCPSACSAITDVDCLAVCDNGMVEPGETCDPVAECDRQLKGCVSDANTIRTPSAPATVAACTFTCTSAPRPCGPADGFCPTSCPRATTDPDCNDTCAGARDISAGGVFDAVISTSTQQNVTPPACSVAGPEVLFTFTLADREVVYLALLDAADPTAAVPAYLELFMGCPPAAGAAVTCGNPAVGERACGRAPFPFIDSGSVLGALTYYVAVRAPAGTTGSWRLHYQHVPASCAGTRITPTETLQTTPAGTTCQQGNNVAPSCAPMNGQDRSFLFAKCPNQALRFTTCGVTAGAAPADSALSAIWGSQTYQATTGSCVPSGPPAAEVACYTLGDATCPAYGARLEIEAQHRPGLVAVSVDTEGVADACGIFILDYRVTSSTSMAP